MLSVILFGRNDDHGYNYHKRVTISLNCLAELLSDPYDEIIFVDYNSSDEMPSIIEAIQDTLTDKAKKLIKVFRVRSYQHARFNTHLPILEPVARNVGIRRSNPKNKWILSTNIDMIFVPQNKKSITEIVACLEDGYFSLPRFELPENLWELSLNRLDPLGNILFLKEMGPKLHLDTVVRKEGFIQFDNLGDFQLMLRKDVFEIRGFDEKMLKGWHTDSNLAKRLFLMNKTSGSLEKELKGYHCNHTYKESMLHSKNRTENDWNQFVGDSMMTPVANGVEWGLADEQIEEILLGSKTHLKNVVNILEKFPMRKYEILNNVRLYSKTSYSIPRIFTYLVDHLSNSSKSRNISYFGHNLELAEMIELYLKENQFSEKLNINKMGSYDSLVIFDFGFDEGSGVQSPKILLKKLMKQFLETVRIVKPNSKIIGINVNYTDYNVIFQKHLDMRVTSYITGSSYGYTPAKQKKRKFFLTPALAKKKLIFNLRYLLVRYFNKYSDRARSFARRVL